MSLEKLTAKIDSFTKGRFVPVNLSSHVHILRPLPWKHENHGPVARLTNSAQHPLRIPRFQRVDRITDVLTNHGAPAGELFSADLQSVGDVSETYLRMVLQVSQQIRGRAV